MQNPPSNEYKTYIVVHASYIDIFVKLCCLFGGDCNITDIVQVIICIENCMANNKHELNYVPRSNFMYNKCLSFTWCLL